MNALALQDLRKQVKTIEYTMHNLLDQMRQTGADNIRWQKLADQRYELLKQKRSLQSQMGKIVKAGF